MEEEVATKEERLGKGVGFERIRRITGYLVGDMGKWNDAKKAEEHDRVRHSVRIQETTSSNIIR